MTALAPLFRINQTMDRMGVPYEVNESRIESFLVELETSQLKRRCLSYWLTMARVAELAVLCAGHYADNGEFTAAGDLLVNPRKIYIKSDKHGISFTKNRHGRLSDQLKRFNRTHHTGVSIKETEIRIIRAALLPYFRECLSRSGFFKCAYLEDLTRRMERIAETLGFLMAFGVDSCETLYRRMDGMGTGQRRFIEKNLCRFDQQRFDELGRRFYSLSIQENCVKKSTTAFPAEINCRMVC